MLEKSVGISAWLAGGSHGNPPDLAVEFIQRALLLHDVVVGVQRAFSEMAPLPTLMVDCSAPACDFTPEAVVPGPQRITRWMGVRCFRFAFGLLTQKAPSEEGMLSRFQTSVDLIVSCAVSAVGYLIAVDRDLTTGLPHNKKPPPRRGFPIQLI